MLFCAAWGALAAASATSESPAALQALVSEARAGNGAAQLALADHLFAQGDVTNAIGWFRTCAERGVMEAQLSLAACYAAGRGVRQDFDEAARWTKRAEAQLATMNDAGDGNTRAQVKLGDISMARGDSTNAVRWYRLAANRGYPEAQMVLASCYASGRGVAKDPQEAARWSSLAASAMSNRKDPPAPGMTVHARSVPDSSPNAASGQSAEPSLSNRASPAPPAQLASVARRPTAHPQPGPPTAGTPKLELPPLPPGPSSRRASDLPPLKPEVQDLPAVIRPYLELR